MTLSHSQTQCPICGTPAADLAEWLDIPVDVKTGRKISTGKLVWCEPCDVGLMQRLPTAEESRESYDLSIYYTHGQSHIPVVKPSLLDRVLVKLAYLTDRGHLMDVRTLQAYQPDLRRVLDIGCGGGGFVGALAAEGRELVGIEPDPRAREVAASRGIAVFEGTAEAIPNELRGQKFDLVIMTHVFEHCSNPQLALANARDFLAPGGLFYCEVPNCGALHFQTFSEISEMLDVPRHIHFFTAKSLRLLFDAVGLEVEAQNHHGYTRHFNPDWRAWENQCHSLLTRNGAARKTPRRSWTSDLRLLARTAFAPPEKKYDCIGLLARPMQKAADQSIG